MKPLSSFVIPVKLAEERTPDILLVGVNKENNVLLCCIFFSISF